MTEGQTVHLPCHVKQLGKNNLAWVRSNDSTILTIDTDIVTHDKRFRIVESDNREDWVLIIRWRLPSFQRTESSRFFAQFD